MRHAWTRLFRGLETFLMKRKKFLATPSWCKFLLNAAPGGQSLRLATLRGQLCLKIKHQYIIASGLSGLANLEIGHQVPHLIRIYTKKELLKYDASFTHQRSSQDERSLLSFTLCVNILNFREAISWNLSR